MSLQGVLPLNGFSGGEVLAYRPDHLLVAGMVERGSKVLDIGCGDGDLLQLLESRGCRARASITASPRGSRWCRATPIPISSTIPTMPSTM
jgi:hypothetical protein